MGTPQHELSSAELEVMRVLWDQGPCTVRQVWTHLRRRGRRVAYTTVQTFLSRLEQKGCVRSDRSGLAYIYRPLLTRQRVSRSRLRELLEQLYDGSAGPLVLHLVRTQRLSRQELDELHRLIERLDTQRR